MNRIKDLRVQKNLTQAQLAELIGTTDATVQRLETNKRQLTQKWAEKIAIALGVDVSQIFHAILPATTDGLIVAGEVQAGVWREIDVSDEPKYPPIPLGPDPRYTAKAQFALLVQGESMNKVLPSGAYIVCVPWAELGRDAKDGDLVVVERRRDGMVETTVKRISVRQRKTVLMPESTDPRFQAPIELNGNIELDEIAITALVVGRYQPL
jgi:transcriptional regulator with XRE-family HTH domain